MYLAGQQFYAGDGVSTILPDMDFETFSLAGYVWDADRNKWACLPNAPQGKKGLPVIGAAAYARHPSTRVLSLYYDLKDGKGKRHWKPGMPNPQDLFDTIAGGGLIEAFNIAFEWWIWNYVCTRLYGWPSLAIESTRCAQAKAAAFALPRSLDNASKILGLPGKQADGFRLLMKFSMPRNPTKGDKRLWITPEEDPEDAARLYSYNAQDIDAEQDVSIRCPDLTGEELEFWLADQRINRRGVQLDGEGVVNCRAIVDQVFERYNGELQTITGGQVSRASEVAKLTKWLQQYGVHVEGMDDDAVQGILSRLAPHPPGGLNPLRRVLEIRQRASSAAVKKVYAMTNQASPEWRLHDLFNYHGAHTGRATGEGPQPTNLPNSGPVSWGCACGQFYGKHLHVCPFCGQPAETHAKHRAEWSIEAAESALGVIASQSLDWVEWVWGDALAVVSGCLRGLFTASEGHDLICADYSAIEAVGLAETSGEEWRREVFRTHGKIYEMSAAMTFGISLEEILDYKKQSGEHHPIRKKGKVQELALGYQGWIGALKAFGADEFMTEDEMKTGILAWRDASPKVVEFWGTQPKWSRGGELYGTFSGTEGMAIMAVLNPGQTFRFRGFEWFMKGDVLYCRLLSGRCLKYHRPRLAPGDRNQYRFTYEGWNTNPKNGPVGWIVKETWGGRLTENLIQAVCRDILRYAIINLEKAGYKVVLHVYDEIVAEVPKGTGSEEEFCRIMSTMPPWAKDWPVKAAGAWRGRRYRK